MEFEHYDKHVFTQHNLKLKTQDQGPTAISSREVVKTKEFNLLHVCKRRPWYVHQEAHDEGL